MDKFQKLKNKSQRIYELSLLLKQKGLKRKEIFDVLSNKYNRAFQTIELHYRNGRAFHKKTVLDNVTNLLKKINCTNFETLLKWYKENDDAFFDTFYQEMKDGHIDREEFQLIMLLVGEDGEL